MGDTVAFVQRGYDSRFYVNLVANPRLPGQAFASAGAAQKAADNSVGRSLRWTQVESSPAGERWRGDDPGWWPMDLDESLAFWLRADRGVRLLDVATGEMPDSGVVWSSIAPVADGEVGYTLSPAGSGSADTLVQGAQSSDVPAVRMYSSQMRLDSDFATLEPPFTIAVACRYEADAGIPQRAVLSTTTFRFRVGTAGPTWNCLSNTTPLNSAVAPGALDVIAATVTTSLTSFYINGVLIGTTADVPAGALGAITLGSAGEGWSGDIHQVVIVDRALSEAVLTRRLVPYLQRNRRLF